MVRNDNYWRTPAAIKNVVILKVEDVNTRLLLLKAGDADSAYVPIQFESQFTGSAFRIVKGLPTFNVEFFCFNQWINISDLRGRYGNAIVSNIPYTLSGGFNYSTIFADSHVRKAFAAAFDYTTFIDSTYLGNAEQLKSPIPKGMFGYNDTVPKIGFNKTMARDQLENYSTNYLVNGSFTIPIFYNSGNPYREAACNMLKDQLEAISPNIHINVIASTWSVMIPMMNTQPCAMPGFTIGWAPDYADADDYVLPFLHSTRGIYPYAMAYSNASMDALIDAAAGELNVTQRLIDYYDIAMGAYHDMPMMWLSQGKNFHVERAWVSGYFFNPMYSQFVYYNFAK
jgi:peptide/nickel transport system substrate-binding protein